MCTGKVGLFPIRSQSALVHCVAQNRSQHFSRCGHAILADSVAVKLQHQFDIAVAKQSLYGLRIGSDANQKRRQTVPSPGIVGEGVETGWRASLVDEGTVRLSSKGESDRITQRSAVQIRPPQPRTPLLKWQWRSPFAEAKSEGGRPSLD